MGYSSNLCKACKHGILEAGSADEGINEWMAEVVILNPDGNMTVDTEYTGYVGDYERFDGAGAVWLHKACWEVAGRPDADAFDGPSHGDHHQGGGGTHAHIIDPRITDEAERARLLEEGLAKRNARIYTEQARKVQEWLDKSELKYHREEHGDEMWRLRYHYGQTHLRDEDGGFVLSDPEVSYSFVKDPTGWDYYDKLNRDEVEGTHFTGTEDELKAHLAAEWAKFIESDECKAYVAHREAEVAKHRAEQIEKFKTEGRFKVSYHSDHQASKGHTVFYVRDEFEYDSDVTGFSTNDHEFKGARGMAQAKADRLNEAWAAAGHPQAFSHDLFEARVYPGLE